MRLPNGYGSVYKLSGNRRNPRVARKTVGWKDNFEKRTTYPIYKFIGTYPDKKSALQALAEYNKDPYDLHIDKITLEELYDKRSREHFEEISESNIYGVKAAWKICQPIKDMKLLDLKLDHFQKLVDESGKNYPTLRKLKVTLGLMYDYAVKHELVSKDKRDIIRYIEIKKAGNPNSHKREPFSKKEINTLWENQDNEYVKTVLILIYSGCRIGELLDIKKENVNLEEKYLNIIASKTQAGIRKVPIADKILPLIDYRYNKNTCDYLISTPKKEKFIYSNYYDSYRKPLMKDLDMSHRPHDTRHTCVSLLTSKGVDDRIIKRIVGHKGQGITQTVYTHFEMEDLLNAINKI